MMAGNGRHVEDESKGGVGDGEDGERLASEEGRRGAGEGEGG